MILLFIHGYLNLIYKKWYCTLIGFIAYLIYGSFLLYVLDFGNPMYMTVPAIYGSIFTIWVIDPIYLVVYALIIFIVELVRNRSKNLNKL